MRLPAIRSILAALAMASALASSTGMPHAAPGPAYNAASNVGVFLTPAELAAVQSLQASYDTMYPGISHNIHSGWASANLAFLQPYVEYKIARQRAHGNHFEAAKVLWGHVEDEMERKQVVAHRMRLIQNTQPGALGIGGGQTWLLPDTQSTFLKAKTAFYGQSGGRDAFAGILSHFNALYTGP